jgi:hypothetical protein
VRTRLDVLAHQGNLLEGQTGKGRNGRLEYKLAVIDLLRDLAPLTQEPGKSHGQAAQELAATIERQKVTDGQGEAGKPGKPDESPNEWVRLLIEEKDRRITDLVIDRDHWRDLAEEYRRALPAPREVKPRRSWFVRLLRPVAV